MRSGLLGLVLWMGILGAWEIRGVVKDKEGKALPWASVEILGLRRGTASDDRGVFWLEIPDTLSRARLRISYVGFRPETLSVSRGQAWVTVRLAPEAIEVATVTSYAPYRLGVEEVSVEVEAKPIDVYTTPGAAADPLQALKAYTPFTGNPDVAALAIRGGRTEETLVEINGILYPRPYIFSLSTGGLFFSIPVEAVSKLEAYPGTLPASRGFRLAGGVLMGLETRPLSPFLTVSTGGGSFGVSTPVGNFWGQVNSYRLMAKLNGDPVRYSVYPAAYSGTYAEGGMWGPLRWKIFGHGNLSESEGRLVGNRGFRDREFQGVGGFRLEGNPTILTLWSVDVGTTFRQDTLRYATPKSTIRLDQRNRTFQGRGEWTRWWSERMFSVLGGQVFVRERQYAGVASQNGDTARWRTPSRDTLVAMYGSLNLAASGRDLRGGLGLRLERKTNTPWAQTQVLPRLFVEKPLQDLNLSLNVGENAQWKDSLWVRGWLVEGSL
ncbi:MAG: TonB-dependent receptor, partial [Candidatus Hydrothermae bacterium]|nr:TonB-dependent receptor [Candidatus Hydrothermae bacterium]